MAEIQHESFEQEQKKEITAEKGEVVSDKTVESTGETVSIERGYSDFQTLEKIAAMLQEERLEKIELLNRASGLSPEEIASVQKQTGLREKFKEFDRKARYHINMFGRGFWGVPLSPLPEKLRNKILDYLFLSEEEAAKKFGIRSEIEDPFEEEEKNISPGPPIKRGESFSPEEEIQDILTLPKEERREKLKEFKEKLAYQKEGMGKIQEQVIQFIREKPDASIGQLFELVRDFGPSYGFTEEQKEVARSMLQEYATKHNAIREVRKETPNDDELYGRLFGAMPQGKVEIIEGPMTLYFRCHDPVDYARIHSQAFIEGRSVSETDIYAANMSGGVSIETSKIPALSGTIIAENSKGKQFGPFEESILRHEEQHAIRLVFNNINDLNFVKSSLAGYHELEHADASKERMVLLERNLKTIRNNVGERAKNEILAYFKQNAYSPQEILDILKKPAAEGGLYDYLAHSKDFLENKLTKLLGEENRELIQNSIRNVLEIQYRNLLDDGVHSFQNLIHAGCNRDQAIAILIKEPLPKWEKAVKRLLADERVKTNYEKVKTDYAKEEAEIVSRFPEN